MERSKRIRAPNIRSSQEQSKLLLLVIKRAAFHLVEEECLDVVGGGFVGTLGIGFVPSRIAFRVGNGCQSAKQQTRIECKKRKPHARCVSVRLDPLRILQDTHRSHVLVSVVLLGCAVPCGCRVLESLVAPVTFYGHVLSLALQRI
jgi:hypothetical protein